MTATELGTGKNNQVAGATTGDKTTGDNPLEKPWTEHAEVALRLWLGTTRDTVRANAKSISGDDDDEEILKKHVHKAIKRFETSTSIYTKRSDWAKWIGFFALGVFIPNLMTLLNAENADQSTILWTVVPSILATGCILYAFVSDRSHSHD